MGYALFYIRHDLLISSTDFFSRPRTRTIAPAVKHAEVLGIGYKTIDSWLQKSINCNEIQHVAHGKYSKSIDKIA